MGDRIGRRVIKGIRRAISTPWETIERQTDQRRVDNSDWLTRDDPGDCNYRRRSLELEYMLEQR